jgi:hypothetical protein
MESVKRPTPSPANVRTAMYRVLEYLWDDEETHYQTVELCECPGHIFVWLTVMQRWLDEHPDWGNDGRKDQFSMPRPIRDAVYGIVDQLRRCDVDHLLDESDPSQSTRCLKQWLDEVEHWLQSIGLHG